VAEPDPDSIDITIQGSWRKNARAQTQADMRNAILDEIARLIDDQLTPIFRDARALSVGTDGARERARHMRWLALFHFPDSAGQPMTAKDVVRHEQGIHIEGPDGKPSQRKAVKADSAHDAAVRIATRLGLHLELHVGAPFGRCD
jgi:hypothetical protein